MAITKQAGCWWEMLPAIPRERQSAAYERLRRVWFDHTWKDHPFMRVEYEIHLTATLFENFTLFDPRHWVHRLLEVAGIRAAETEPITNCAWGYEVLAGPSKLADIAIHARDAHGDFVIVVESKAPRGAMKKTDGDPANYLDLDEFRWAKRRWLIYLIDEADVAKTRILIDDPLQRSGICTWQALAGLQIELTRGLPCAPEISGFVAGAIQYQYLQHRIVPTLLAADYLTSEPSCSQIGPNAAEKMTNWMTKWRISE